MKKQCKKLNHYEKTVKPEILTILEQNPKEIRKSTDSIISIMPYLMDVQIATFKELIYRINAMDEAPGIMMDDDEEKENNDKEWMAMVDSIDLQKDVQSDSSDDENEPLLINKAFSLKQLYSMRNILNDSIIKKEENLEISVNKLSECINYKVNDMEREWEKWNADNIVDWICNLENGRFRKYEEILRKELNDGDATGSILPHLDVSDWRKSFCIKNWKDAVDLNKYKDILVTNNNEKEEEMKQHQHHHYVSPFDPNEEGADTK